MQHRSSWARSRPSLRIEGPPPLQRDFNPWNAGIMRCTTDFLPQPGMCSARVNIRATFASGVQAVHALCMAGARSVQRKTLKLLTPTAFRATRRCAVPQGNARSRCATQRGRCQGTSILPTSGTSSCWLTECRSIMRCTAGSPSPLCSSRSATVTSASDLVRRRLWRTYSSHVAM